MLEHLDYVHSFIKEPVTRATEGQGEYEHTFGGELEFSVVPPGGENSCHLLYTIDTEDPQFVLKIPGVRFLPLIYCQQYNAAAMAYRVSKEGIEVDYIESLDWYDDFPYENYPESLPKSSIKLEKVDRDTVDILNRQSEAQEEADYDTDDECDELLRQRGYPFTKFGGMHAMVQGIPEVSCKNPSCPGGHMNVFGVIWNEPVKGVYLWDDSSDYREYCDIQIIYQVCSECNSIHVCNRCS